MKDILQIGDCHLNTRLFMGTGKYASNYFRGCDIVIECLDDASNKSALVAALLPLHRKCSPQLPCRPISSSPMLSRCIDIAT